MNAKPNDMTKPPADFDPDTPLTDEEYARGRMAMLAIRARQATGLSQSAFGKRYGIPAATQRDWEQGRRVPDSAAQSYLRAIARLPDVIAKALDDAA